jgi:ribosomal protein S21
LHPLLIKLAKRLYWNAPNRIRKREQETAAARLTKLLAKYLDTA